MAQYSQYGDLDTSWKIWSSNLGSSKGIISSPKHPDQLQRPPSLQLNENQSFFTYRMARGIQSEHSHPSRAKFKNQWSYTSTKPVSLHGTYWDFIFPLPPTYVQISQEVTYFLSYKGSFLYITYTSHAHYMNHLFHLHSSN